MKPYTLKDREGESISPTTSTRTVFDERGVDLDTLLAQQKQGLENALKEYAKKTEVTQSLAGKQNALSTTTDLHITADNIIGLTEAAKMRLFIDLWNEACGKWGRYNAETGFFELNGLTDITYEEAVRIYNAYTVGICASNLGFLDIRTNIPFKAFKTSTNAVELCYDCHNLEVFNYGTNLMTNQWATAFHGCGKLHTIIGMLTFMSSTDRTFDNCKELTDVKIRLWTNSNPQYLDLKPCPKLNIESLRHIADSRHGDTPWVVGVHQEVYAKLTDETNAEWHAVLVAAAEKNITFATV